MTLEKIRLLKEHALNAVASLAGVETGTPEEEDAKASALNDVYDEVEDRLYCDADE